MRQKSCLNPRRTRLLLLQNVSSTYLTVTGNMLKYFGQDQLHIRIGRVQVRFFESSIQAADDAVPGPDGFTTREL